MPSFTWNRWAFVMLFISVLVSLRNFGFKVSQSAPSLTDSFISLKGSNQVRREIFPVDEFQTLDYDYYRNTCPQAERIVRDVMQDIVPQHRDAPPALLRLFFHDCFIGGCDASVFLNDSSGTNNHSTERQAGPNRTLKGFDKIDIVKEELERICPGVVSCADVIALATRDAVVLAGGPFYPIFTGRKDSIVSFYEEAMNEIPKPTGNISETLRLFGLRGFSVKETVSLLGAHNIGRIGCDFIQNRLYNFMGTGLPDPTIAFDFLFEMRQVCQQDNSTRSTIDAGTPAPMRSRAIDEFVLEMANEQNLVSSISSGEGFGAHYYQNLLRGRGILYADQQLMADVRTAGVVRAYASDGGSMFHVDFARAMVKMSGLGVLSGSEGEIRTQCSMPADSS